MNILINGNNTVVRKYGQTLPLGLLLNPGGGVSVRQAVDSGRWWALDNGSFGKTRPAAFWRWVAVIAATPGALDRLLFVVPPDVPFCAAGSLYLLDGWWRSFAYEEIPLAFVGQDGLTRAMWRGWAGLCSCFFIGGTTAWKLGREARMYAALAKRRGMHVHMGRVNSVRRLRYAMSIGCDSVDGTGLTKFADDHLPRVKRDLFPAYLDMTGWVDPSLLEQHCCSEGVEMKVAELKRRLVPGTPLTRVNCLLGPHRKLRTVAKVNSVDFMTCEPGDALGPLSHCAWPKASELVETPLGFRIVIDGQIAVEYEWGHNPEPSTEYGHAEPPPEPKPERVTLYTDAHVDYDGFSTRTEAVVGTSNRGVGREVRRISIEPRDYDWQTGRYGSGMCRYTHERMKLEDYVEFGDWTLTPEPIDLGELDAINSALGIETPPSWVGAIEHADDDIVVIDGDHPDSLGALFGVLGGGDD